VFILTGRLIPVALGVVLLALACCSPQSGDKQQEVASNPLEAEVAKLRQQVQALEAENAELKATPSVLLSRVQEHIRAGDVGQARDALSLLLERHPDAPQATEGKRAVNALVASIEAKEREEERLKRLGFKALRQSSIFTWEGLKLSLSSAELTKRWAFDAYGSEWHYREAPRESLYLVAKLAITSKDKDPALPGIGVYSARGGELHQLGELSYEFSRWMNYGSYLGNGHDFRNDFEHTETIRFSAGTLVEAAERGNPLFLIAAAEGCHNRTYERFQNPPVKYVNAL